MLISKNALVHKVAISKKLKPQQKKRFCHSSIRLHTLSQDINRVGQAHNFQTTQIENIQI